MDPGGYTTFYPESETVPTAQNLWINLKISLLNWMANLED